MKIKDHIVTIMLLAFLALIISIPLWRKYTQKKPNDEGVVPVKNETPYFGGYIMTVQHDGHLFIVEGRANKGAILHHPDCPCRSSE